MSYSPGRSSASSPPSRAGRLVGTSTTERNGAIRPGPTRGRLREPTRGRLPEPTRGRLHAGGSPASAEREAVDLDPAVEKLDLAASVVDGTGLADELVGALAVHRSRAVTGDVRPGSALQRLAVKRDPERDRSAGGSRSHEEIQVAGVEL